MPLRTMILFPLLVLAALVGTVALAGPALAQDRDGIDIRKGQFNNTVLNLDPEVGLILSNKDVREGPVSPATNPDRDYTFPITEGHVNRDLTAGRIDHKGGVRFAKGKKVLKLTDFQIDLASTVVTAKVNGKRVPLLTLVDKTAGNVKGNDIKLRFAAATLTDEAAAVLNKTFGGSDFKKGQKFANTVRTGTGV